jgi:hypothetical protein
MTGMRNLPLCYPEARPRIVGDSFADAVLRLFFRREALRVLRLPDDVPILEISYALPSEAAVLARVGFGSLGPRRVVPDAGWAVASVTRHENRGPVVSLTDGSLSVKVAGAPGDSGGPIVDVASGRVAAVVSRGLAAHGLELGPDARPFDDSRVSGPRLIQCRTAIAKALAR